MNSVIMANQNAEEIARDKALEEAEHYRGGLPRATLLEHARDLRKRQTPPEEVLWAILRNRNFHGLKFRRQHQIGTCIVDFYCHEVPLAIEVDGSIHKLKRVAFNDKLKDEYLHSAGIKVLHLSNEWVMDKIEETLKAIEVQLGLQSSLTPDPSPRRERGVL